MKRGYFPFASLGEKGTASTTAVHKGQLPNWKDSWSLGSQDRYTLPFVSQFQQCLYFSSHNLPGPSSSLFPYLLSLGEMHHFFSSKIPLNSTCAHGSISPTGLLSGSHVKCLL